MVYSMSMEQINKNFSQTVREIRAESASKVTVWDGYSENELRTVRQLLADHEITSERGQWLDTEVYFLKVWPEYAEQAKSILEQAHGESH